MSEAVSRPLWRIIEYIVRDFVDWWFQKSVSQDKEFSNDVRELLDVIFSTIARAATRVDWFTAISSILIMSSNCLLHFLWNVIS